MLALAVMPVVFVLGEKNKPREIASYLTASKRAKSLDMPE